MNWWMNVKHEWNANSHRKAIFNKCWYSEKTLTQLMFIPVELTETGFPSLSTTAREQVASNPIPSTALLGTFFVTS
jgi:hypothetical protein